MSDPNSRPSPRGSVVIKRVGGGVLLLLVLAVIGVALLPSSFWRGIIVRTISRDTGHAAAIDGGVDVHLFTWNPRLTVEGLRIANAQWAGADPMLTVRRFEVTVSLSSLLRGHLMLPRVIVEGPHVDVQRDASGRTNWDLPTSRGPKVAKSGRPLRIPVVRQIRISDGALKVTDRIRKLKFDGHVSLNEVQNAAATRGLDLRGTGVLNGKPFQLRMNGEPLLNVDRARPYNFDAALTAADIKLTAGVVIPHPFDLASIRTKFDITGTDLADAYYLSGLALPNTPPYDISGTLERDDHRFTVNDLRGRVGTSDIAGKLSVDTGDERPVLTAQLTSKELKLADLAAPLGTQAGSPRQTHDDTLQPPSPDTGLLLPDADLQVQRVRGMDADVTFDAASVVTAKLPIRKVHFHLSLNDGKLKLAPLAFTLPQGQFSGTVTIDARPATPRTDLDMKLTHVDLAQFKPKSGGEPPFEGSLLGRIQLYGSGSSVHKAAADANGDVTLVIPQGEMREVLAELTGINVSRGLGLFLAKNDATTEVRCGVANFHADSGDLNATTFVVDTTHVLITGRGHVDLKSERLDLALRGQPKEVRLLRLRTPVTLQGSLSHPKVGVQAGKAIAQAGGAAALGVLLTPLAAVLAFVDRGLAKDANCAALLNQAEQGHNLIPKSN